MVVRMGVLFQHLTRLTSEFQSKIDPILARTTRILDDSESRIASIMGDAAEITHVARSQAQKVDRVFTDAVERLRIQVIRADQIIGGTLEVIEETGSKVRRTLWTPFYQASAVLKGLKVGLDIMRGHNHRPEPDPAHQDEELFI